MMERRKRILGEEYPDTLFSMANLALMLESQNRHKEAVSLMENCFELRRRFLGPKYPDTKSSSQALHEWKRGVDEHEQ